MINITLHQLKVLQAIKTHGSLTAAAHALHITQPAVSNILKQLELVCDYALTETIGKKIFLTQVGERLVQAADQIYSVLEQTESDINALQGHLSGTMTIAIVSTAKYFIPKLLGEFRKICPLVKIKLTVCNRQEAIRILKDNTSDFLIMSQPPDDMRINTKLFYQDQLVVVASPDAVFKRKIETLYDLNDEEWIIRESGSGTRIVMKKLFKQNKMLPNVAMEVGNNESIKQLIMANMGVSIVSKQSIELELQQKLIRILPLEGFPVEHPWYFVINKGKQVSRITNQFFEFVKDYKYIILS